MSSILDRATEKGLALVLDGAEEVLNRMLPAEADRVVDKVFSVAKEIVDDDDPRTIAEALAHDPALFAELQALALHMALEAEQARLADLQSARARDVRMRELGQKNVRADVLAYGALTALLVLVIAIVVMVFEPPARDLGPLRDLVFLFLGSTLAVITQVYNFEFGSSAGSKKKEETMRGVMLKSSQ